MRGLLAALLLLAGCVGDIVDVDVDDRPEPRVEVPRSGIGFLHSNDLISNVLVAGAVTDPVPTPPSGTLDCSTAQGLLLCDDFEGGELNTGLWELDTRRGGEVSLDDAVAFQGTRSVRMRLPQGEGVRAAIQTDSVFPFEGNHLFGRFYVYLTPEVPAVHSFLVEAGGRIDGKLTRYRLDSNNARLNSRYTHPDVEVHGGYRKIQHTMPVERWLCVEFEYDGSSDEMRYWMDGEFMADMEVTSAEEPRWVAPQFDYLVIGWHNFQSQAAANTDVYYDSIALATERIGCE